MALSYLEDKILKSIIIPSENDPNKPEFPPDNPKFPATETFPIEISGFANVWMKNEASNPTGTHKDRMAWEIVVSYRDFLLAKQRGLLKSPLPHMSIISSGAAAIAIQNMLNKYKLPHLKVLVDANIDDRIIKILQRMGCEVFPANLAAKPFHWSEILALTNNKEGFDITSGVALDPTTRFYDWMSYEIINNSPDYAFIPFGTGNLYENVLNINKKEVTSIGFHDPRFQGDVEKLRYCNFIGATTNNPKSKADKLYSPHLPFVNFDQQWIEFYKTAGFCGPKSNVLNVKEESLDKATEIAEKQNIEFEPSGLAGLALMLQMKDELPRNKKYLIVNTGKSHLPKD